MIINGKEFGFFYSVGAVCDFNDWVVKNPERSYASAVMQKALLMSKAYCKKHGGTPLSPKDFIDLPARVFTEIEATITAQEKADSERTVEVAEDKSGNAESAAQ